MREAIDLLTAEHRLIGRVLASLGTFVSGLDPAAPETREALGDYIDFLRRYVEFRHERMEESIIFTELARYGGVAAPVALLEEEHRQRAARLADMAAVAVAEGPLSEAEVTALDEAAAVYSSHLRAHILKEDRALFPLAGVLLPEDKIAQIAEGLAAFAQNSDHLELVALAERLIERYPPLS